MSFGDWMNDRVKGLDWIDMGCVKAGAMLFALLAAKIWPPLLSMSPWVYAVALLLVSVRPMIHSLASPGNRKS